jgi:lysozyme
MSEINQVPGCLLGIDVSHYQGEIDWVKVAESGVKFAWIKATDGLLGDPRAGINAAGAAAAGIPFGLYHFWRPQPAAPALQARNFLQTVTNISVDEFGFALDIETGALTEADQTDALAWLTEVGDALPKPTAPYVYVSPSYARFNLTDPAWLRYPLWTAHYTELAQPNTDKWPAWTFWQRQANGTVPGIPNVVDIDWFNGSVQDFLKFGQRAETSVQPETNAPPANPAKIST